MKRYWFLGSSFLCFILSFFWIPSFFLFLAYLLLIVSCLLPSRLFSENIILFFLLSIGCLLLNLPISGYLLFYACVLLHFFFLFLQKKFYFYCRGLFGDPSSEVLVVVGKLKQVKKLGDVQVGDILLLRQGETCFVDGEIYQGRSRVSLSSSSDVETVLLKKGDSISCGSKNLGKELSILVTTSYDDTLFSRFQKVLLHSDHEKFRKLIFPFGFGILTHFLFLFLFFFLVVYQFHIHALEYGLMILMILYFDFENLFFLIEKFTLLSFYRKGIYVLHYKKLLQVPRARNFIFTKTGILTLGSFHVTEITSEKEKLLLETVAYAEYYSKNRIGICLNEYCQSKVSVDPTRIQYFHELMHGVSASVDGVRYLVGNYNLMMENGVEVDKERFVGTNLYVSRDHKFLGIITLSDQVSMSVKDEISALKKMGIPHLTTFSKDNEIITRVVSNTLGIYDCYSELTYRDRSFWIQYLKDMYRGPQAYISDEECNYSVDIKILFGGSPLKRADIIILENDFSKVTALYSFSKRYLSSIRSYVLLEMFFKFLLLFLLLWIRDILVIGGILIGGFLLFSLFLLLPFILNRKGE